ncbi:type I restriction enzyme HsdR N-terminal domain-containing protein [Erythrobacteraceae bacterium E2-1 Yellow Sea]|nr:type I restriction enzyme HsdR N-terminal domain-containing protein [Erythrobacteraceae bacterium E2-1 Yellow Sea]
MADRDISEADTVTVIKDMLSDVFGYDKYSELTSEQQIRGTFCDLAIRVDGKTHLLCEVKSAGTTLNESHLRQAVNYGAHNGIEWVVLSNAIIWKVYRISFTKPIQWEEVLCLDMGAVTRSADDLAKLFMLCKESISGEALDAFHRQSQIVNRFVVAQTLLSDAVLATLRKEFRRTFDGLKVSEDELHNLLVNEVIKRDALDGDGAKAATSRIKKAESSLRRKAAKVAKTA